MGLSVEHVAVPVPTWRDLARALWRSGAAEAAIALSGTAAVLALGLAGPGWALGALLIVATACLILPAGTRALLRSWRAARKRRPRLNGADDRVARAAALRHQIADAVRRAEDAWSAYIADAVVGQVQSILHQRAQPDLSALRALADLPGWAAERNIRLVEDGSLPAERAGPRLPVPPRSDFAPDRLSPPLMSLNAASLAHAQAEGARRAEERHARTVELAAQFDPPLRLADAALLALASDDAVAPPEVHADGSVPYQR